MRFYSKVIGILVLWPILPVCGSKYNPDNYNSNNYDVVDPCTGLIAIRPAGEEAAVAHMVEGISPVASVVANVEHVKPIRALVVDPCKIGKDPFTMLPDDVLIYILKQKGIPKAAHAVCFRFRNLIAKGLGFNKWRQRNVFFQLPNNLDRSIKDRVDGHCIKLYKKEIDFLRSMYWYFGDGVFCVPSTTPVIEGIEREVGRISSVVTTIVLVDKQVNLFPVRLFERLNHVVVQNDWSNPINDFRHLTQNIKQLEIAAANIADFKPLLPYQNIKRLALGVKGRCDFKLLPSFTNIQCLSLENTEFVDCAVLAEMTTLKSLSLNFSILRKRQFSEIGQMKHLRGLFLRQTGVDAIAFLKGLTNLEALDLSWNQDLRQVSPLGYLVSLKSLSICHTKMNSLSPLKNLKHLQNLDMVGLLVPDLHTLTQLRAIHIWDRTELTYDPYPRFQYKTVSDRLPTLQADDQLLNAQTEAFLSLLQVNPHVGLVDKPTLKDHMSTGGGFKEPPA